jgi:ribosomal 50S subunit-recycling heat shock protein
MRIDLLLKTLCLVRTRSQGRAGCAAGAVRINGAVVKPSREARAGDIIDIRYPGREIVIELLELPGGQVSKKEAASFYRVIRERTTGPAGG